MGDAEDARVSRFAGLGTARREKLEGAGGETSAEWLASQHAQDASIVVPTDDPQYGRMLQPGPAVRLHAHNGPPTPALLALSRDAVATSRLTAALQGMRIVDTT